MKQFVKSFLFFIVSAAITGAILYFAAPLLLGSALIGSTIIIAGGLLNVLITEYGIPSLIKSRLIESKIKIAILQNNLTDLKRLLTISHNGEWSKDCWNYRFSNGESLIDFARNASNYHLKKYQQSNNQNHRELRMSQNYFKSSVMLANEMDANNNTPIPLTRFQKLFAWVAKKIGISGNFSVQASNRIKIFEDLKSDLKNNKKTPEKKSADPEENKNTSKKFKNLPTKTEKIINILQCEKEIRDKLDTLKASVQVKEKKENEEEEKDIAMLKKYTDKVETFHDDLKESKKVDKKIEMIERELKQLNAFLQSCIRQPSNDQILVLNSHIDRMLNEVRTMQLETSSMPEHLSPEEVLKNIETRKQDETFKPSNVDEKKSNEHSRGIPPEWAEWAIDVKQVISVKQLQQQQQEQQQEQEEQQRLKEEEKYQMMVSNLSQVKEKGFVAHSEKIKWEQFMKNMNTGGRDRENAKAWCEALNKALHNENKEINQIFIDKDAANLIYDKPYGLERPESSLFDLNNLPLGFRIRKDNNFNIHIEYSETYIEEQKKALADGAVRLDLSAYLSVGELKKERDAYHDDYTRILSYGFSDFRLREQFNIGLLKYNITLSPEQSRWIDILYSGKALPFTETSRVIILENIMRRLQGGGSCAQKTLLFLEILNRYYDENMRTDHFLWTAFFNGHFFNIFTNDLIFQKLNLSNFQRMAELTDPDQKDWFKLLSYYTSSNNSIGINDFNSISDALLYFFDFFKANNSLLTPKFDLLFPRKSFQGNTAFLKLKKILDCLSIAKKTGNIAVQGRFTPEMPTDLLIAKQRLQAGYNFVHIAMCFEEKTDKKYYPKKEYVIWENSTEEFETTDREGFKLAFPKLSDPDYITSKDFKSISYSDEIHPFYYRALYLRYIALNVQPEKMEEAMAEWQNLLNMPITQYITNSPPNKDNIDKYKEEMAQLKKNLKTHWKKLRKYALQLPHKLDAHEEVAASSDLYNEKTGVREAPDDIKLETPLEKNYDEKDIEKLLNKLAEAHPIIKEKKSDLTLKILEMNRMVFETSHLSPSELLKQLRNMKGDQFNLIETIALLREVFYRFAMSASPPKAKWLRLEQLIPILLSSSNDDILFEIGTSEGKTLILQFIAIIKALQGHKHDVITHNEILANDSAYELAPIARLFGLTVATKDSSPWDIMKADIYYVDIDTAILDDEQAKLASIKESVEYSKQLYRGNRKADSVSVDEVDDFIHKQATKTWQIAEESKNGVITNELQEFIAKINNLVRLEKSLLSLGKEEKLNAIKLQLVNNAYYKDNQISDELLAKWISAAVMAMSYFPKVHYVTKETKEGKENEEKVCLVDKDTTGRINESTELGDYVHQCIAAWEKENGHPNVIIPNLTDVIISGDIASYMSKYSSYDLVLMSEKDFDERVKKEEKKPLLCKTGPNEYKIWGCKDGIWQITTFDNERLSNNLTWPDQETTIHISRDMHKELFDVLKVGHKYSSCCGYTGTLGIGTTVNESLQELLDVHENVVMPRAKRPESNDFAWPLKMEQGKPSEQYNKLFRFPAIIKDGERKDNKLSEYETTILQALQRAKDDKKSSILFCNEIQECDDLKNLLLANGFNTLQILDDMHDNTGFRPTEATVISRAGEPRMITIVTAAASRGTDFDNPIDFGFIVTPGLLSTDIQKSHRLARNGKLGVVYEILKKQDLDEKSQAILSQPPLNQAAINQLYDVTVAKDNETETKASQKSKTLIPELKDTKYTAEIIQDPRVIVYQDEKRREEKDPRAIAQQAPKRTAINRYQGMFFNMMDDKKLDDKKREEIINTLWKPCYKKLDAAHTSKEQEEAWQELDTEVKKFRQ